VRNEEMLHKVKEKRNNLQTIKIRTANNICDILHRNCRLKYVTGRKTEGTIEVRERQGRRLGQLPDNLDERRWYWKLK
jgi:hypothetical protein